ncbi:DNA ligase [Caudoviricetes sp.]|nr:DNA ligase [Caudoviricetes sp.]
MSSPTTNWGFIPGTKVTNPHEVERKARIRISVAAWAYENSLRPIMSDADYDALSKSINPRLATGNPRLDHFFKRHFSPHTGLWIHKHPEPQALADIYHRYYLPNLLTPEERKRARRKARRKNR